MSDILLTEYEHEPIPGLPGIPPPGERILWQGSPDWRVLARTAFHTRLVGAYFGLLVLWALASALAGGIRSTADLFGLGATLAAALASQALLHLLAWATARSSMYTLTNRRVVLRIGVALPKCINLPLALIGSADLAPHDGGTGDIALTITGRQRIGYAALWPHARPWRLAVPQPMLRAVPEAQDLAALLARTCLAAGAGVVAAPAGTATAADRPAQPGLVAA